MRSQGRWSSARRSGLQVAALLGVLGLAHEAAAFCRTTSVPVAVGYDPAAAGACWTDGDAGTAIYLAWPARSQIGYSLVTSASAQVSLADATAAAHQAFAEWAGTGEAGGGPMCPGGPPNVEAFDDGPVDPSVAASDCGLIACPDTVHDTHHLIVFRDTSWSGTDAVNTLALTTVTYGRVTGTIYDADTEINTFQHMVTTVEPPPPSGYPANTYDLQSILTHEAGHFLGLAHSTDTEAVMYAYYHPGSIHLTADDVAGICAIYPFEVPSPPSGGCQITPGRSPTSIALGGIGLALLGIRVRRERGNSKVRKIS